jgi:tryptophan synthase alpha chain
VKRLTTTFAACKAAKRAALVTFITAGDGETAVNLDALIAGGADVIELGMPFTDPMADGAAIQKANLRALAAGTTTKDIFTIAAACRTRHPNTPLVLMGYANPMLIRGADWFAAQCKEAGVDGVICVDLPPEESAQLQPALAAVHVDFICLATPTSDSERLPKIVEKASGFLYYVSVAGITGKQQAAQASIEEAVTRLRQATTLPIAVGFGVRTPEQAAAIGKVAGGVVVGSAIIELVEKHGTEAPAFISAYVASLRAAL